MPSSHHHSLSLPIGPLTPPLTPSSSINNDKATRIVLLSNLIPTLDPAILEHAIHQILNAAPSRIKGINTRPLPSTHSVPVVFFDSRDASSVFDAVSNRSSLLDPLTQHGPVAAEMISVNQLLKDIGPSPFLDSIDVAFHLKVNPTNKLNLPILQTLLSSFGEIRTFAHEPDLDNDSPIYLIEYFDSRDGDRAIHDLDGKVLFAMSLSVHPLSSHWETLTNVEFPTISSPPSSSSHADADTCEKPREPIQFGPPGSVSNLRVRFRSLGFTDDSKDVLYASGSTSPEPPCVYCPVPPPPPPAPNVYYPYDYMEAHYSPAWPGYDPSSMMLPLPMSMGMMPLPIIPPHAYYEGVGPYPPYQPHMYGHLQPQQYPGSSSKGPSDQPGCSCSRDREGTPPAPAPASTSEVAPSTDLATTTPPSERNQLNIKRIEEGVDTRTTVMIKNIPNKMSDRDLMVFIERVCPRRIDFFYLRMDFQNGCNVGYAFVNFIHVQDLLAFAKARLGVKWNMFSSEKVLQMSYANYQGKEALVEKFKNSAIMDEREAWRPRIFYSSGSNQGFPEPFPPPTHMRRKERSFFNRGALFVPAGGPGAGRGVRVGNGKDHGTELLSRNLGLTFGKGWMGRTTAAAAVRNGVEEGEVGEVGV